MQYKQFTKGEGGNLIPHESVGGVEIQLYPFFNLSTRLGWVVNIMMQYQFYRSLGGPWNWYRWVRKISVLPGFKPWNSPAHGVSLYWPHYHSLQRVYKGILDFKNIVRFHSTCVNIIQLHPYKIHGLPCVGFHKTHTCSNIMCRSILHFTQMRQ